MQQPNRGPAVLTSDVINEAQALFQMVSLKKEGVDPLISHNGALFVLRGIGLNPTATDMEALVDEMKQAEVDEKKDEKKKKKEKESEKKKKEEEEDKKTAFTLPEDVHKYTWLAFIEAVEQTYKNQRRCEEEILNSFKVFDRQDQRGKIGLKALIDIMTTLGDDVLSPAEVDELKHLFGSPDGLTDDPEIEFIDFAKTMQDGQRPPPPPPPDDGVIPDAVPA